MSTRRVVLLIDGQNDFIGTADGSPYEEMGGKHCAALPVKNGELAMTIAAGFIGFRAQQIDLIIPTLDTHEMTPDIDIGHPRFWRSPESAMPEPFAPITYADFRAKRWIPYMVGFDEEVDAYLSTVGTQVIWPRHCIYGTWGHELFGPLKANVDFWEKVRGRKAAPVYKGMYPRSEQYGVFEAAVPNDRDPRTQYNWLLYHCLMSFDEILVMGLATDFCVKTSVEQLASKMRAEDMGKLVLLTDCMSAVGLDQGKAERELFEGMRQRGARVMTTSEWHAQAAA